MMDDDNLENLIEPPRDPAAGGRRLRLAGAIARSLARRRRPPVELPTLWHRGCRTSPPGLAA